MKHVPYFQSKHKVIFFIFVALAVLVSGLFITAIAIGMGIEGPLEDNPVENAILFILTIFALLLTLYTVIFVIDLIVYFVKKHKALKEEPVNNEPVIQEEVKPISVPINEEKVAETKEEGLVYDFKEKHNPSFKKSFLIINFVNAPAVFILGSLLIILVFIIVVAFNITNGGPTALIRGAIGVGITVVIIVLFHFLAVWASYSNDKRLEPINLGTKVYADYMESYMDIDQDLNNTQIKSTLKTKIDFSIRVRYRDTKRYLIVEQMINKKVSVMFFDKNEVPQEALAYIKSKLKK